jgi:hypothetical protein
MEVFVRIPLSGLKKIFSCFLRKILKSDSTVNKIYTKKQPYEVCFFYAVCSTGALPLPPEVGGIG